MRGGEDEAMPVVEVGIGVGYLNEVFRSGEGPLSCLFAGRGKPGDEESGSNAGSSEGAGRLLPDMVGSSG